MLLYVMVMVNKDIRGLILKDEWIINFVIFIYLVCIFYFEIMDGKDVERLLLFNFIVWIEIVD